jgi:predicted NAD/FAD-binding protein
MIFDILRFNRESPKLLDHAGEEISLASFLKEGRYSKGFIENYIIPMGAAIWSSSAEQMLDFPARFFVRFFKNHGMLSVDERPQWRVIRGGSRSYIAPLCAPFKDRIHLNSPVRQVTRLADGVKIKLDGGEKTFDHVIFASHSDQTLSALGDATTLEREVLKGFAYQPNEVVLHTDISVLPKRKKAWAAWNYLIPHHAQSKVSVTYNMNILQGLTAPETFSVSLNMGNQINPAKVLKRFIYDHPVYSIRSVISQNQWAQISQGRTHFCGAYWGNGFHEDGVASALKVCKEGFGAL